MAGGIVHAGSPASAGGVTVPPPVVNAHAAISELPVVTSHAWGHCVEMSLVVVPDDDVCFVQVHVPAGQVLHARDRAA